MNCRSNFVAFRDQQSNSVHTKLVKYVVTSQETETPLSGPHSHFWTENEGTSTATVLVGGPGPGLCSLSTKKCCVGCWWWWTAGQHNNDPNQGQGQAGLEFYFSQDSFQCLSSPRSSILVLRWGSSLIAIGHLFVRICHVAASQPLIRGEFGNIFLVCPHRELCHKVNKWPFTGQINESSFVLFVFSVWG